MRSLTKLTTWTIILTGFLANAQVLLPPHTVQVSVTSKQIRILEALCYPTSRVLVVVMQNSSDQAMMLTPTLTVSATDQILSGKLTSDSRDLVRGDKHKFSFYGNEAICDKTTKLTLELVK